MRHWYTLDLTLKLVPHLPNSKILISWNQDTRNIWSTLQTEQKIHIHKLMGHFITYNQVKRWFYLLFSLLMRFYCQCIYFELIGKGLVTLICFSFFTTPPPFCLCDPRSSPSILTLLLCWQTDRLSWILWDTITSDPENMSVMILYHRIALAVQF